MAVRGQTGAPLALGSRVLLSNLGTLPSLLLTLGGLPANHLFAALGILAVTLIATHRLVDATTSFAQANARPQAVGASERRVGCGIVEMSQGRCFLPPGRPEGSYKAFRATFILGSAVPAGRASSATILPWLSIPADYKPRLPLRMERRHSNKPPTLKMGGGEEGDGEEHGLDLFASTKDTRKETPITHRWGK
jgi:hypothetical protein